MTTAQQIQELLNNVIERTSGPLANFVTNGIRSNLGRALTLLQKREEGEEGTKGCEEFALATIADLLAKRLREGVKDGAVSLEELRQVLDILFPQEKSENYRLVFDFKSTDGAD